MVDVAVTCSHGRPFAGAARWILVRRNRRRTRRSVGTIAAPTHRSRLSQRKALANDEPSARVGRRTQVRTFDRRSAVSLAARQFRLALAPSAHWRSILAGMSNDRIGRARPTPSAEPGDASSSATPSPAAVGHSRAGEPNAPARPEALNRLQGRRAATASSATGRRAGVATLVRHRTVTRNEQAQIAEYVAAVEAAQRHGSQWQLSRALGGHADPQATLASADAVAADLHRGLQALDSANALNFEPPQGYEAIKAQLHRYLLQAAEAGILALSGQMQQWQSTGMKVDNVRAPVDEPGARNVSTTGETAGPSHRPAGAQQPARSEAPSGQAILIALALQKLSDARGKLAGYEQIVDDFPHLQAQGATHDALREFARLAKIVAQSVTRDVNSLSIQLNVARLELFGTSLDSILGRMNPRSMQAVGDAPVVQGAWDVIDRAREVDPKQLADAKVVASAYLDGVDALSEQLCIEAASRIDANDDSPLWRCALEAAGAFQTYGAYLRQVRDEARPGAAASPSSAATPAHAVQARPSPNAEDTRADSSGDTAQERQTASASRQRARTPAASSAAAERGAPSGRAAPMQEPAAPRTPGVSYRDLARSVDGDVVSIARALGKDSSTLEQMRSPSFDPIESAQYARNAVQSWLGDIDNVRKTLRRATAGASAAPARIEQLTDRLDALTVIHQHIATVESDALKALACPKAKHLKRLLQLNQLERVSAPLRLPSDGDVENKGTLFEMTIQPKPLASGEAARPLFVHLHTSELMDAPTAGTVAFRRLTAAHVKTEAHRRLGAKWEQMANALGSVHRGKIDAALLGELRAFARTA